MSARTIPKRLAAECKSTIDMMQIRAIANSRYAEHSPSITSGANSVGFAEVDEVGRHRVAGQQRLEIREPRLDDVELDAAEERRSRTRPARARARRGRSGRSTACGIRRAGIFAASRRERRAAIVRAAADHHEILRHGARAEPPHAALESDRRDVMLAAAVRAAADLDARAVGGRDQIRTRAQVILEQPAEPARLRDRQPAASPRPGSSRRRRSLPASASPSPAAARRR